MGKNTIGFRVSGVAELQRAFRELPKRVANKVVRQAIRESLKPILADAKRRAPKESGKTAAAIKLRAAAKRKRGVIGLEIRIGDQNFTGATFYAGFQEFGTKRGIKGRHFMEDALVLGQRQAIASVISKVAAGIEREAAALRKSS